MCWPWVSLSISLLLLDNYITCREQFEFPTPTVATENQVKAVEGLIRRIIPKRADEFIIEVNSETFDDVDRDTFEIQAFGDKIKITASSGVTAAWGFHYYLKYFCNCHVSWSGNQLNLPQILPTEGLPIRIVSNDRFRYYQNVCTASYSMLWWNWTRWEQEIDWMALNGINLPLAFIGQEIIWQRVFLSFGFSQEDIDTFFTGPAFLAWNRMGNIQTWGGPLPQTWHCSQMVLQHQILKSMREFGMMPIIPAFAGHVPCAIKRLFPNTTTTDTQWSKFKPPYSTTFLEPQDPLFSKIGSAFVQEYLKEFGTNHFYNSDLFNEMKPNSSDPEYLKLCGKTVFDSITAVDPKAIWVIQGWMFYNDEEFWQIPQAKALLTSVPLGRMMVLDLQSELNPQFQRLNWYYEQPFIWCMLHNFGGVLGLYGSMDAVNEGPFLARQHPSSTLLGTGLTPEGINQNYVMYDLMNEMAWQKEPVHLDEWIKQYVLRRYGIASEKLVKAFLLLKESVYNAPQNISNHGKYVFVRRPSLKLKPIVWYDPKDVFDSWSYFVNVTLDPALGTVTEVEPFRYDLVDVTRQSLQLIFDELYLNVLKFYRKGSLPKLRTISYTMLTLLKDLDRLLASERHFLLGHWLQSAKSWATNKIEKALYEFNSRNQISLWGPNGEILDYANKQWSGLIKGYYVPRWTLFLASLEESIRQGTLFNQTQYQEKVFEFVEKAFTLSQNYFPTKPQGNSIQIARELHEKYSIFKNSFKYIYKYCLSSE